MDRLYNVTIEYLGRKKVDKFPASTICLGKDGAFLVMDAEGESVRFAANDCKVEQIAAHVIIMHGYTDKPRHITAYCIYANGKDHTRQRHDGQKNNVRGTSNYTTASVRRTISNKVDHAEIQKRHTRRRS